MAHDLPVGLSAEAQWVLGVTLALGGNLLIAFSLVLQKHVHCLREESKFETWAGSVDFLFALAITGLILGEAGNFAAFGLASPTVVSPLGAVAVLANALLSTIFLNETFLLWNLVGLCLVVLGSVVVVSAAPPTQAPLTVADLSEALSDPTAISYLLLLTLAVAVLLAVEPLGQPTTYGERWLIVNVMVGRRNVSTPLQPAKSAVASLTVDRTLESRTRDSSARSSAP